METAKPTQQMSPLQRKRLAAGLTMEELGDLVGVSYVTIGRWEAGKSMPSAEFYPKLAKVFRMKAEEVVDLFTSVATA
jgi:transcriptional regulator with XRE-family HTH domain